MSLLQSYAWKSSIECDPFEIKVFAHTIDQARCEVFAILDEIARIKPQYEALSAAKKAMQLVEHELLEAKQEALRAEIPADFFNGNYAVSTFGYTFNRMTGEGLTLGDFIRTTEPTCGPVRHVSFRSCLDG